jgi:hypothetical protein
VKQAHAITVAQYPHSFKGYSGSEMLQYAEHTKVALPFPLKRSVGIDDIFSGLPESISNND